MRSNCSNHSIVLFKQCGIIIKILVLNYLNNIGFVVKMSYWII
jgi:hypothetical protein